MRAKQVAQAVQHCAGVVRGLLLLAVVFFGRRKMQESLSWMAAFWLSVAGAQLWPGLLHGTVLSFRACS